MASTAPLLLCFPAIFFTFVLSVNVLDLCSCYSNCPSALTNVLHLCSSSSTTIATLPSTSAYNFGFNSLNQSRPDSTMGGNTTPLSALQFGTRPTAPPGSPQDLATQQQQNHSQQHPFDDRLYLHPTDTQVGEDVNGNLIRDALAAVGNLIRDALAAVVVCGWDYVTCLRGTPTGHAVVMLMSNGDNTIIIAGGANMSGWPLAYSFRGHRTKV